MKRNQAESRFRADVAFEVSDAMRRVGPELSKAVGEAAKANALTNSRLGIVLAQVIDRGANEFIERVRPRYELALEGGADAGALHSMWVQGLADYMGAARESARIGDHGFKGAESREHVLDQTIDVFTAQETDRINHIIRGIEARPKKLWHERYPFLREIIVTLIGAVAGIAGTLAVQAMGGG